jgi:hypothetical protein
MHSMQRWQVPDAGIWRHRGWVVHKREYESCGESYIMNVSRQSLSERYDCSARAEHFLLVERPYAQLAVQAST